MTNNTLDHLKEVTEKISLALGDEISHADITERIPEVWGAIIESEADKIRVVRGLARVFTDLLDHPGDTLKIPKRAVMDYDLYGPKDIANDLTAIDPNVELTYKTIPVTPSEVGIGARITKQAIEDAMVSVIRDALVEMARGVSQKEDLDGIGELVATATEVADQITYVEANYASDVYTSGKWTAAVAGALTSGVWQEEQANLEEKDILDLGVITEAQDVIFPNQGFVADAIIIHPKQVADLKRSPQFLDASKAGNNSVLMSGQIGTFFGLKVLVSRNLPKLKCKADGTLTGYQAIMVDSSAALALVIKRLATVETKYEPGERMHYIFITCVYKFKRVNPGAVVVINTA